jgi:hypothetical protein
LPAGSQRGSQPNQCQDPFGWPPLLLFLAPALATCGSGSPARLPAVSGGFGTDPLVYAVDILAALHG